MKKNWARQEWIDIEFSKDLDWIKQQRIKLGIDDVRHPRSTRRTTKAIRKLPEWNKVKERLVYADMEEDRWKNEIK